MADGSTQRKHSLGLARRGNVRAIQDLEGPVEFPEALEYLYDLHRDLRGRSGAGLEGHGPLMPTVLESWCRLIGEPVDADEVRALVVLDNIWRHPPPLDTLRPTLDG